MVEFKSVVKKYSNGTLALSNVNFCIKKGEFAFLVGPSGSGKSTILKLILKEEDSTEGEVFVNGYDLSMLKRKEIPSFRRSLESYFRISGCFPIKPFTRMWNLPCRLQKHFPKKSEDGFQCPGIVD